MTNKQILEKIGKQSPFYFKDWLGFTYILTGDFFLFFKDKHISIVERMTPFDADMVLNNEHTEIAKEEFLEAYQSAINEHTLLLHELRGQTENQFIKNVTLNADGY